MNSGEPFDQSTGDVAREAAVIPETVRSYASLGLLEFCRLANGTRLFQRSAAAEVRKIREQRLANRGRKAA
jgi:DNA-binding transcriptional MerR regulator